MAATLLAGGPARAPGRSPASPAPPPAGGGTQGSDSSRRRGPCRARERPGLVVC